MGIRTQSPLGPPFQTVAEYFTHSLADPDEITPGNGDDRETSKPGDLARAAETCKEHKTDPGNRMGRARLHWAHPKRKDDAAEACSFEIAGGQSGDPESMHARLNLG